MEVLLEYEAFLFVFNCYFVDVYGGYFCMGSGVAGIL